jgi:DNA-binding transcriptional ArsR family regulator
MQTSKRLKAGAQHAAPIFAALGDETRLRLVVRLCSDGAVSITSLTAEAKVTRQAITKHLKVLEKAGLVTGVRTGRQRIYELERKQIQQARQYLDVIGQHWDEALGRLKDLVEG